MKRQILAVSVLIVCALVRAQSQTESVFSSESSMLSAEPSSLSTIPIKAWSARYKGPGDSTDVAKAIAVDDFGNVYVTGYSIGPSGYYDYATIKYNSAGAKQWVARYNGPANKDDEACALAIDNSGNVYVTGYSYALNGYRDYATVKYNGTGVKQWVVRYNGPANKDDEASSLAVDDFGNVYVTGHTISTTGIPAYATVKYNSEGIYQWVARYYVRAYAKAIAVDGSGYVYVTGYSAGVGGHPNFTTIKYSSEGIEQWVAKATAGPGEAYATALLVGDDGNVYVTGYSKTYNVNNGQYMTIKYNNAGSKQWVAYYYNGPAKTDSRASSLAIDGAGSVYVTGSSTNPDGYRDYATVKYNNAGVQQWVARYNGPENLDDFANALRVDSFGDVYVTGYSIGSNGNQDYATIKYNSVGVRQWIVRYNGPANLDDGANAIAVDAAGNIYVTGYSASPSGTNDYFTIKYLASSASVAFSQTTDSGSGSQSEISSNVTLPSTFSLAQNFPNPFNPTTTIRFDMPTAGYAKLVIYNLRGEVVLTLVDGEIAAGYHHATFDASGLASGIYFYRLEAGGAFTATRKMVLQK